MPTIAIVGRSKSGKTSLLCALVARLKESGYSIAVAKHAPHGHDRGDKERDSGRIADAGAVRVAVVSPGTTSRIETRGHQIEETISSLADWASGCDVLLLEGWKSSNVPKILVGDSDGLEIAPPLIGSVKEGRHDDDVQISKLAEKIVEVITKKEDWRPGITVRIDGDDLRLKRFPATALSAVITGYLDTLEDVPSDWESIEIRLKRR